MAHYNTLTDKDKAKLESLHLQGVPYKALAERYGLTRSRIAQILREQRKKENWDG